MTTVQITLPDQPAREGMDAFFAAMERMAEVAEPPALSPAELAAEIATLRKGLAQAERGEFVPDEEMEAFFSRYDT